MFAPAGWEAPDYRDGTLSSTFYAPCAAVSRRMKKPAGYQPRVLSKSKKCRQSPTLARWDYHRPSGLNFRVRNGNGCDPRRMVTDARYDTRLGNDVKGSRPGFWGKKKRIFANSGRFFVNRNEPPVIGLQGGNQLVRRSTFSAG